MKDKLQKLLPKSEFAKNVLTLMTGTALAQVIPFAISPILTRLYTPENFGFMGLLLGVVAPISVIASGKYEMAIFLPKKKSEANLLVLLSVIITFIIAVLTFLVMLIFNSQISNYLGNSAISKWLYLIPVFVVIIGLFNVFIYWNNRNRNFKLISTAVVSRSLSQGGANLLMGVLQLGASGLIFSNLIGVFVAFFVLVRKKSIQTIKNKLNRKTYIKIIALAKRYHKFPKYFIAGAFINTLSAQIPILMFTKYFDASVVGFFMLAQRIIVKPSSLITKSVGDAFRQNISDAYNDKGDCRGILTKNVKRLLLIGVIPFTLLGVLSPYVFDFVFGESWAMTGKFVQILSGMFFLRFALSPLSSIVIQVSQKLEIDIYWQIALICLTSSSIYIGHKLFNSVYYSLFLYASVYAIMYIISFFLAYKFSKKD